MNNPVKTNPKPTEVKETTKEVIVTPNPTITTEVMPTLQVVELKTAKFVFDRLEQGIKMKEQFNKFREKVEEFETFATDYEEEGLVMEITNIGTGNKVELKSVPMILDFIENVVVKAGKNHLKQMEQEIVNFAI